MIKREREKGSPLLVLDAGNSLTGDEPPANVTKGASSVESMNMMEYDAMALGHSDLKLGRQALTARMEESDFPFLSVNAMLESTGEPIAPAFITGEIEGHSIAVIGVTGDYDAGDLPGFEILDPVATVQQLTEHLSPQADVIILLSSAGNPTDLEIAAAAPDIDLIVEGGPFQSFGRSHLDQERNTLLVHTDYPSTGHAGRNLGIAKVVFDEEGKLIDHDWQLVSLDTSIPADPEMTRWRQTK